MAMAWWPWRHRSVQERQADASKRAARLMNRYDIPGVAPLTFVQKVEIVVLALMLAFVLLGMAGLWLPPAPHP